MLGRNAIFKKAIFSLVSAWLSFSALAPSACLADASSLSGAASPSAHSSSLTSGQAGSRVLSAPLFLLGFCAGAVVGTPICFLRKLPQETIEGAHGMVGSVFADSNKMYLLIPAGLAYLPFAGCWAAAEAPVYALRNAWLSERPFCKEQFSLGVLDEKK